MSRQPYPGLRAFERDETDIFFGRETQLDGLLAQLGRSHFLAVIGPSGYGKSSLVRTGLLPSLQTGFLPQAGSSWRVALCHPGHQPFTHLAEALLREDALGREFRQQLARYVAADSSVAEVVATGSESALLEALLQQGPHSVAALFADLVTVTALEADSALLLVVDQFEEIFRHAEQGAMDEAAAFVELLLASSEHSQVFVVLTMRSDYLGDCAQFYGLAEAINAGLFLIPRLTRDQLRAVITEPARVFGGAVDSALVTRLLNDIGNNAHQLPVLQHALMRMWDLAGTVMPVLTLAHYELIGGLQEALSRHADEALAALSVEQQRIAAVLFKSLTERGRGQRDIRRPVRLSDVAAIAQVSWQAIAIIVEEFRTPERCFLTPPFGVILQEDTVIDMTHESLIWLWQRLQNWVKEETDHIDLYQRLEGAALRHASGQGALWRTPDLEQALAWRDNFQPTQAWARRYGSEQGKYFSLAMRFLDKSVTEQWVEQRGRRLLLQFISGLVALAMIFVAAAISIWIESNQLEQKALRLISQYQTAILPQSWFLADMAEQQLDEKNVLTAIRLALHALPNDEQPYSRVTNEARDALSNALQQSANVLPQYYSVRTAMFNPTGTQLLIAGNYKAWVRDIQTKKETAVPLEEDRIKIVAYNATGTELATIFHSNILKLWNVKTGKLLNMLQGHKGSILHVSYNAAGTQLVTTSSDNTARLWDAQNGKLLAVLQGHQGSVHYSVYNRSGTQLVTVSNDNTARLWDTQTGEQLVVLQEKRLNQATYNIAGTQLATSSLDSVKLWNVQTGELINVLQIQDGQWVKQVEYNAADTRLLTVSSGGIAQLWDTQTGKLVAMLEGHKSRINYATYNPIGKQLVTVSDDKTARLWDDQNGAPLAVLQGHEGKVTYAAYNATGTQLVTFSNDKTARLWYAQTGQQIAINESNYTDLDSMIKEAEQRVRYHDLTCEQRQQFFLLEKSAKCK